MATTPKLAVAASKGTHLPGPDDDGSDENFIYGGPENADGPAAARPECTNNIKQIAIAIHALDAGDPSSFQINSADADDMGRSFDLVFPTQTAYEQREGNAVATESLEIAHEGFLHGRDDGWTHLVKIDLTEPTALERAHTPGALLFSFSSEPTWTAIAMAESGGNTDAHAPHGEDSWGLWQIDVDPARDSGDLWVWRKQVIDGTLKDTFDFQQLTSEPTAPEAGHVKAFLGRDMSEPTAPEPGSTDTDDKDWVMILKYDHADDGDLGLSAVDPNNPNVGRPGISLGDGQTIEATDDGLLLPAVRMDDGEASIKDGTSNTFGERYGQTGSIGGISVACGDVNALGDPITFTYTVTSAGGAIAGVVIAATTDNNRTSDFDCSGLTQWASHQSSSDTDIGGFIFPTETYKPTESLFDL